jgi:F0F1-type ATP synthase gamma subunit
MLDTKRFEKAAAKILDVFTDGRLTSHDLMYVAFYTVVHAYPEVALDRLIEYTEHVKVERERIAESRSSAYEQDTLF